MPLAEIFDGHANFCTRAAEHTSHRTRRAARRNTRTRPTVVRSIPRLVIKAWLSGEVPATRTSGASATNSVACLRMSSAVAQRVSIRTLRPSLQPNS